MQKAVTKMNIQLANAISGITGVSGMAIIAAILNGERNAPDRRMSMKSHCNPAERRKPRAISRAGRCWPSSS
jgi:hypothetical protein